MLIKKFLGPVALTLSLTFGLATSAHASLIGDTIFADLTSTSDHSVSPASAVVGAGAEFIVTRNAGADNFSVDVSDTSFLFTSITASLFGSIPTNLLVFSDLDWVGQSGSITGVSLLNLTGMAGLGAANLSFTADTLSVDLAGVSFFNGNGGSSFEVALDVQHSAAAPVPSSLALLGIAAMGIVSMAKKRRKS